MPVGLYTREVLKRLELLRVLRKAVSQEPDVKGIVGKLALGEADAGFVYATDVRAAGARLVAIPLPRRAQPTIRYEAAVVKGTRNRAAPSSSSPTCSASTAPRARACGLRTAVSRVFPAALVLATTLALGFLLFPSWRSSSGFLPAISSPGCGARPRSTRCS